MKNNYYILPDGYTLDINKVIDISPIYNQLEIDEEEDDTGCDFEGCDDDYFIDIYIQSEDFIRVKSDSFTELMNIRNKILNNIR